MKKNTDNLKEYLKKLNDDDLKYLGARLSQRLGGDMAEAVDLMQKNQEVDHWLRSAGDSDEFFDMMDLVDDLVQQETRKRFGRWI